MDVLQKALNKVVPIVQQFRATCINAKVQNRVLIETDVDDLLQHLLALKLELAKYIKKYKPKDFDYFIQINIDV